MLTVIANTENSKTISMPADDMERLGIKNGDEVEISKNESDEIVLRPKQSERTKKSWMQPVKLLSVANRL